MAYEKKFRDAESATHSRWLAFFAKALARQVVRAAAAPSTRTAAPLSVAALQTKYAALYCAGTTALRLYRAALAVEETRRRVLRDLRDEFGPSSVDALCPSPSASSCSEDDDDDDDREEGDRCRRRRLDDVSRRVRARTACTSRTAGTAPHLFVAWLVFVEHDAVFDRVMSFV